MNKIVIATDGSPAAADAVALGIELAAARAAVPVFVHVAPAYDIVPAGGIAPTAGAPHELSASDRAPLDAAERLADEVALTSETKLLVGDPADEIVAYADSIDAEMIVIGSRGRGGFKSALLGSVSQAVLHHAARPVLIATRVHQHVPAAV
jgi:nucleotide-binding universal stress UspA family protein